MSSILAWRTPWTEEPGGLQSIGLHRVRYDCSDLTCVHATYYFSDQKVSLIFPSSRLACTQTRIPISKHQDGVFFFFFFFYVTQILGWFSEVRGQAKDFGGFFQLWIIETKKGTQLKNLKSYSLYQNRNYFHISSKCIWLTSFYTSFF